MFIAKQTLNGHLQVPSTYACSDCHSLNHVLRLSTIKTDDNKMISLASSPLIGIISFQLISRINENIGKDRTKLDAKDE